MSKEEAKSPIDSIRNKMVEQSSKESQKKLEEKFKQLSDAYQVVLNLIGEIKELEESKGDTAEHLDAVTKLLK